MARKSAPERLDYAISLYVSGQSIDDACRVASVGYITLRKELMQRGLFRSNQERKAIVLQKANERLKSKYADIWDSIGQEYIKGESEIGLSRKYGLTRGTVKNILNKSGIVRRTQSEAEILKWRNIPMERRMQQMAAAHAVTLGRTLEWGEKCRQAVGKQLACTNQSAGEQVLIEMLQERNIAVIPQQAIGPYNADIGTFPVAVEVFGGNFHAYGRHAMRFPERCHYFADQGWALVVVWTYGRHRPLTIKAAEYVATFLDEVKGNPSLIGEYRMIGGCGEFFSAGRLDSDDITAVLSRCARLNSRSKNNSIAK